MKNTNLILICLILLVSTSACISQEIVGYITDKETNMPISGVKVAMANGQDGDQIISYTDEEGIYTFENKEVIGIRKGIIFRFTHENYRFLRIWAYDINFSSYDVSLSKKSPEPHAEGIYVFTFIDYQLNKPISYHSMSLGGSDSNGILIAQIPLMVDFEPVISKYYESLWGHMYNVLPYPDTSYFEIYLRKKDSPPPDFPITPIFPMTLPGVVTDKETGLAIEGVKVVVPSKFHDNGINQSTHTNADGEYIFEKEITSYGSRPVYSVQYSHPDYQTHRVWVYDLNYSSNDIALTKKTNSRLSSGTLVIKCIDYKLGSPIANHKFSLLKLKNFDITHIDIPKTDSEGILIINNMERNDRNNVSYQIKVDEYFESKKYGNGILIENTLIENDTTYLDVYLRYPDQTVSLGQESGKLNILENNLVITVVKDKRIRIQGNKENVHVKIYTVNGLLLDQGTLNSGEHYFSKKSYLSGNVFIVNIEQKNRSENFKLVIP
jgi:5-hydroxyisourate hydrolase-like protein (transthyretin family)